MTLWFILNSRLVGRGWVSEYENSPFAFDGRVVIEQEVLNGVFL